MATIAIVAAVAAIVGSAVSAYAQYEAAEQQSEVASYNRKVAKNQAQAAVNAAQIAEEQSRDETRRQLATQRAQVGAAGISTEGSPLAVMLDSVEQSEIEAIRLRYGGKVAESGSLADAGLQTYYGQQAKKTGAIGAGSTLLTGATQAYGQYAGYSTRSRAAATPGV